MPLKNPLASLESAANPWLKRLDRCTDLDFVRSRAELKPKPKPINDVNAMTSDEAVGVLASAFDRTYYVSDSVGRLIADILGRARAGIASKYANPRDFIKTIYDRDVPKSQVEPICLTGLAGIGKSQLLAACLRVLPADQIIQLDDNHSPFLIQSMWHIQLAARQSVRPMLEEIATQAGALQAVGKSADGTHRLLQQLAYRNGVSLLAADEFQFVNQGSNANTAATRMLLMLREIGTTFVYAANYSLVHRLKKRNQEDRQRLLSRVRLLDRDDFNSQDWFKLVQSHTDIAPDVFRIEDASRLWFLTAGLPRKLRYLLLTAYEIARSKGNTTVTLATCEAAYRSEQFILMREDVELLVAQAGTEQPVRGRPDLNLPFARDSMAPQEATAHIRDLRALQHTRANLMDSLTPRERAALKRHTRAPKSDLPEAKANRKRASLDNEDFMEGLDLFKRSLSARKRE